MANVIPLHLHLSLSLSVQGEESQGQEALMGHTAVGKTLPWLE
jgi:hypothetical protein